MTTMQTEMTVAEFEKSLKAGSIVEVRWTNSYCYYGCRAEVVRVNSASIRVRLLEVVQTPHGGAYPARPEDARDDDLMPDRSQNNRVAPLEGKE